MKKHLAFTLSLVMTLSLTVFYLPASAAVSDFVTENGYPTSGLKALYNVRHNTPQGFDNTADRWSDLSGNGYDIPLELGEGKASWVNDSLSMARLYTAYLPAAVNDALYSSAGFTIQFTLGDFAYAGDSGWPSVMGYDNDSFVVYYHVVNGKFCAQIKNSVFESAAYATDIGGVVNQTITIVKSPATLVSGATICLYINGSKMAVKNLSQDLLQGTAPLRIGCKFETRSADKLELKSLAIYDRPLSDAEVLLAVNAEKVALDAAPVTPDTTSPDTTEADTTKADTTKAGTTSADTTQTPGTQPDTTQAAGVGESDASKKGFIIGAAAAVAVLAAGGVILYLRKKKKT